ncbi:MAG: phosphate signaling complex protein PhoU [Acidimicrobiales bacterium]
MTAIAASGHPVEVVEADLEAIESQVLRLFALVSGGLAAVTAAFLSDDRVAASTLVADDHLVDQLQTSTEHLVQRLLMNRTLLTEEELHLLIAVLRIVPELERSGDLVEHIAMRTPQGLAHQLSPKARGMVAEMGRIGVELWQRATDAFAERNPDAAIALRQRDDEIDDLHVRLSAELASTLTSVPMAIEMSLVARFYERLGDHAVNVARRVPRLVAPRGV